MDILNEVVTGRTHQTRHLEVASSPEGKSEVDLLIVLAA
jgi:hypothetical protein